MAQPVRFVVADDLRRSRPTVLVRLLLAVPHLAWASAWGCAVALLAPFQWLWALFAGRLEDDVHSFLARFVRYQVHVHAYALLLAQPYPRFHGRDAYPVDVEVAAATSQPRAVVLLRVLLALPALVFGSVLAVVLLAVAVAAWFACLALGRMPAGLEELGAYCLRFHAQTLAYLLLLTASYPALATAEAPR